MGFEFGGRGVGVFWARVGLCGARFRLWGEVKAANVHFGLYPMILTMIGLGWGAGGPAEH